jgi:uroporphyrinogen decarboxylase
MLFGSQQDNMKYVADLLDRLGHRNLIVAPGCDMPYDIPIENAVAAAQAVRETAQIRKMIEDYEAPADDIQVGLPDYANLPRPLLEAMTLDSASCAACTYMWAAAQDAKARFGDKIDIVEYKYTQRENIARCKKMGVPNLPSLYINGELKYRSIIPDKDELYAVIEELLALHKG